MNQGFIVFRPVLKCHQVKKGKQQSVLESLFPRYLFILLDEVLDNWSTIRSTRGVSELVRFAECPAIVPEADIRFLQSQCDREGIIDQTVNKPYVFEPGENVQITHGSFAGWQAIIKEQDGDQRVHLLITMFGRQQSIKVPISAVSLI